MSEHTQDAPAVLPADALMLDDRIASINAMTTDDEVDQIVRSLLTIRLSPRARLQREASLKRALKMPVAHFNKLLVMARRSIAQEAEAPVRELQIDLCRLERELEATLASVKTAKRQCSAYWQGSAGS